MRKNAGLLIGLALLVTAAAFLRAQNPPILVQPPPAKPPAAAKPVTPAQPAPGQPAPPAAAKPQTPATVAPPAPSTVPATATAPGGLNLQNASLVEVIDILARDLKINYILDPRVKGSVTINTYGEIKPVDLRPLLETILRINGMGMVQTGNIYRIVPLSEISHLPLSPQVNSKNLPEDDRMVLNLIFLKYATVAEMAKLLEPFLGESGKIIPYDPANLLMILDNSRNMRRNLELISLFDSDVLAGQRVRLFEVKHGRPSDLAKDLEEVFKAFALSEKAKTVKFMPIDRINTIIAVAPNPGIFTEVENWLKKLDIPVKITAGSVDNYVYRLKYGRAEVVGGALMQLYGGYGGGYGGMGGMGMGYGGMGYGGPGSAGGYGAGGYPGAYGGGGYPGAYGGAGYPGAYGGAGGYPGGAVGTSTPVPYNAAQAPGAGGLSSTVTPGAVPVPGAVGTTGGSDLTGSYLGMGTGGMPPGMLPRIIPNPFDNTLLVQATPQQWEQISHLLEQIDVPPRQVLIEAKVYEVDLTGVFSAGVSAFLQQRDAAAASSGGVSLSRVLMGTSNAGGLILTSGMLVGRTRELLGLLSTQEATTHAKVISAPSVIATDSIAASINVGQEVPTLASQAVSGVQVGGTSQFANTISNRSTGVSLNILARVNASGIVTMVINQEVSAPQPPSQGGIQSPSFSKRNVQTQVTVQDGDTISIGGIIQETDTSLSSGIPFLHRIPVLGAAFGAKSSNKARTELIVFLTPRVIYDTNEIAEASEELKAKLKHLRKLYRE